MPRIVVGVDGSQHSRRALVRALEEAELRDATVDVLYVYPPRHRSMSDDLIALPFGRVVTTGGISIDAPAHHPPSEADQARERAESQLQTFVTEASAGKTARLGNLIALADAHPAEALIDASRTADLLVIGTRGLGGFTSMLVGSVAHQCMQHARCPMLVLPPE